MLPVTPPGKNKCYYEDNEVLTESFNSSIPWKSMLRIVDRTFCHMWKSMSCVDGNVSPNIQTPETFISCFYKIPQQRLENTLSIECINIYKCRNKIGLLQILTMG
jgi:hypothetical protein